MNAKILKRSDNGTHDMTKELIFMDGEFAGLRANGTDLLSIALIKETGEELYLELEYEGEVDDWVRDNIIPMLKGPKVSKKEAKQKILEFVGPSKPFMVAYVNQFDWMAICGLFGVFDVPFYWKPIDFCSILYSKGFDITLGIEKMALDVGININNYTKHHALDDTRLMKDMWDKLQN
ncbi:hypothetical protein GF342_03315 [Candidatus Woesearchaeota archaeon]|nr:hypothetical protein [Candidatus Woesearchaeota archaeon]